MGIGLMVNKSGFSYSNPGSFPGRLGYEFLFNLFEDSNEEIMGREWKEEILWGNVGKHR